MMSPITRRDVIKRILKTLCVIASGSSVPLNLAGCSTQEVEQELVSEITRKTQPADVEKIKLSITYDNVSYDRSLTADWGFSCFVEGLDKTILFDTGKHAKTLLNNMAKLNVHPSSIDSLVISHDHEDHIAGATALIKEHPEATVSLVKSFRSDFKNKLKKLGAQVTEIKDPAVITENCISTGELKDFVRNEHSLVILTNAGSIVVTGCAHPGVVTIVNRAKRITNGDVLLLMGGFHLLSENYSSTKKIARSLKDSGVRYIAPTHCSGSDASRSFAEVFGNKYLDSGVGKVITSKDIS